MILIGSKQNPRKKVAERKVRLPKRIKNPAEQYRELSLSSIILVKELINK